MNGEVCSFCGRGMENSLNTYRGRPAHLVCTNEWGDYERHI